MGRWYGWADAQGMPTRRFSPAEFWTADAILRRIDSVVAVHLKGTGPRTVAAEDFIFAAMDESAKSGVKLDWPAFLKSWRGLFVRLGFKSETIEASYGKKAKTKRNGQGNGRRAATETRTDERPRLEREPDLVRREAASAVPSSIAPAPVANRPMLPALEIELAHGTWGLYHPPHRKPKSDSEVLEFHRSKTSAIKAGWEGTK